jgi:hypothetical protein
VIAELEAVDSPEDTALSANRSPHRTDKYASVTLMGSGLAFQATWWFLPRSIDDLGKTRWEQ